MGYQKNMSMVSARFRCIHKMPFPELYDEANSGTLTTFCRKPKYLSIAFLMIFKIQHETLSHGFANAKLDISIQMTTL